MPDARKAYDLLVAATGKQRRLLELSRGALIGLLWVIGARCKDDERAARESQKAQKILNAVEVYLDPSLRLHGKEKGE